MKKLNSKGFTLIELLAVITIMGILMLVAIPAVSRTIENARRDTFMDTAKAYVNAIKTAAAADEIVCSGVTLSARGDGYYFVKFNSADNTGMDLLEQGGKSSWGNAEVKGIVVVHKTVVNNRNNYEYAIIMADSAGRGIGIGGRNSVTEVIPVDSLKRSNVGTSDNNTTKRKLFYDNFPNVVNGTKFGGIAIAAGSPGPIKCDFQM